MFRSEYDPHLPDRMQAIVHEIRIAFEEGNAPQAVAVSLTGDATGLAPVKAFLAAVGLEEAVRCEAQDPRAALELIARRPAPAEWAPFEKAHQQLLRELAREALAHLEDPSP